MASTGMKKILAFDLKKIPAGPGTVVAIIGAEGIEAEMAAMCEVTLHALHGILTMSEHSGIL